MKGQLALADLRHPEKNRSLKANGVAEKKAKQNPNKTQQHFKMHLTISHRVYTGLGT